MSEKNIEDRTVNALEWIKILLFGILTVLCFIAGIMFTYLN